MYAVNSYSNEIKFSQLIIIIDLLLLGNKFIFYFYFLLAKNNL